MADHRDELSPCYSWFIRDWRASHRARKLSWKERGFYRECLDWSWDLNGLPGDKEAVRDLLGATKNDFVKLWPAASQFYAQGPDGRFRNARQEAERAKQKARRGIASAGGRGKAERASVDVLPAPAISTTEPLLETPADSTALHIHTLLPVQALAPVQVHTPREIDEIPGDEAFHRFRDVYPASRRSGGHMVEQVFADAMAKVGFALLIAKVEQHKQSAQWLGGVIPGMQTWLTEEHWTRELPSPSPFGTSAKTAGNMSALTNFTGRK